MQDSNFALFHKYNRLVRRELVQPLACSCGTPLHTALGENDELVLRCYVCKSTTRPGQATLDNVRAVVKEHFE